MKYPIDAITTETFLGHLVQHDRAQRQMIHALTILIQEAMSEPGADETEWFDEAKALLKAQAAIKMEHENRAFNAKNGHHEKHDVKVNVSADVQPIIPIGDNVTFQGVQIGPEENARLNQSEKGFGEEMSEAELERLFSEKSKPKAPKPQKRLKDMSDSEISRTPVQELQKLVDAAEAEERQQDMSNDIYKVKARVSNLAVSISGGNLTPVGEMMVNSFVHVVKDLYDFAENLQDREIRSRLMERIRKHESMPGTLISAASAGVRMKK